MDLQPEQDFKVIRIINSNYNLLKDLVAILQTRRPVQVKAVRIVFNPSRPVHFRKLRQSKSFNFYFSQKVL